MQRGRSGGSSRDCVMEVVKDLTCPICLELYSHPVILPCSHVMCRQPCAEQVFEGNFIRCPVCRDNCYVSGGLHSLPRVITLESIIEKVRAERKKRNAANQGQGRENCSFDDVFSDITSDSNRCNDRTPPIPSPISPLPVCNSNSTASFPEGESSHPACFSPREEFHLRDLTTLIPNSGPQFQHRNNTLSSNSHSHTSNAALLLSSSTSSSQSIDFRTNFNADINSANERERLSTFTTDAFPQWGTPQRGDESSSSDNASTTMHSDRQGLNMHYIIPSAIHHTGDFNNNNNNNNNITTPPLRDTTPTSTSFPHHSTASSRTHRNGVMNRDSNQIPLPVQNWTRPITTTTLAPQGLLRSHNTASFLQQGSQQAVTNSIDTVSVTEQGRSREVGASNSIIQDDQAVLTSTPRSDLRNIRLCHEQSLANLRACSDSIKALQQSRPSFKNNSHNDSFYSPRTSCNQDTSNTRSQNSNSTLPTTNTATFSPDQSSSSSSSEFDRDVTTPTQLSSANQISPFLGISQCEQASEIQNGDDTKEFIPLDSHASIEGGQLLTPRVQEEAGEEEDTDISVVKISIQNHLQKLCDIQSQLLFHMNSFTQRAQTGQELFDKGRSDINKECDSLVAEIENKRYNFLSHIDDERKQHRLETNDAAVAMEKLLASSQELGLFVEEMLESKPQTILSTAASLLDSLSSAVAECQTCLQRSADSNDETMTEEDNSQHHVIDARLQWSFVERLDYLSVPQQPAFDVDRCTRNASTVALVFRPPNLGDVIDRYEISYCSDEQKTLGIEERYYATMADDDPDIYAVQSDSFPLVLIENLCQSTHYYFCVCAVNKKGKSSPSDYIQCKTLSERECVVLVPSVSETQCQVSVTSATMTCPSLATVTSHQCVHHRLLQGPDNNGANVWKGAELKCEGEEFTVDRLSPGSQYTFVVIAYNGRGECQTSSKVVLHTPTV